MTIKSIKKPDYLSHFSMLRKIALAFLLLIVTNTQAQNWYVDATNGNDNNDGSFQHPFKSIYKAKDSVANYVAGLANGMTSNIYIYLRSGVYSLDSTLIFNEKNSGNNGFTITYQAFQQEKVKVTGGKKITGWALVAGTNYYSVAVPTSSGGNTYPNYLRQIWVNGRRATQAKSDFINVYPKPFDNVASSQVCDGYIVKKSALKTYSNLTDIRVFHEGIFKHVEQRIDRINNLSDSEQVMMMRQPMYDTWTQNYVYNNQNQIQIVNALEELDEPGEFYFNRNTRILYYYPRFGEDMQQATMMIPAVETLVAVKGSANQSVKNIAFIGIDWMYGNWSGPLNKEIGRSQADLYADYTSIEGQFCLENTSNISIKQCRFEHLASAGIYLSTNNNNTLIEGNIFNDLTAAAIIIGTETARPITANSNSDILITNNLIRNIGSDFYQASGIYANASKNVTIWHNDVADVAYFGINQRYGASNTDINSSIAQQTTGNTLIAYNKVTNFGTASKYGFGVGDEVAGIYFFGVRTSTVRNNYVRYGGKDEFLEGAYRQDQYGFENNWENNVAECKPASQSFSWFNNQAGKISFKNCYANVLGDFPKNTNADTSFFNYEPTAPQWSAKAQLIIDSAGLEPQYQYLLNHIGTGENIAYLATATSSSNINTTYNAAKINDGIGSTYWKPANGNETKGSWVQLSFPKPMSIYKIQLVQQLNTLNPDVRRYFEVRLSNDSNFTQYQMVGGQAEKSFPYMTSFHTNNLPIAYNSVDVYGIDTLGYRFIRIYGRAMSWAECRVYGVEQPIMQQVYSNGNSLNIANYINQPTPLLNETWSTKVVDTTERARVYFGKDLKNWVNVNSASISLTNGTVSITNGNNRSANFKAAIYHHENISFKIKITENGTGTHRLSFAAPYFNKVFNRQENYSLEIKKNADLVNNTSLSLTRYNKTGSSSRLVNNVLISSTLFSEFTPIVLATYPSGINTGIVVMVGNDTVINIIDNNANRITQPGYLLFNPGSTYGQIDIQDIPVAAINIHPSDTTVTLGNSLQLKTSLTPLYPTISKVMYQSKNPLIASVKSNGMVTANAIGKTIIIATTLDALLKDSLVIEVQQPLPLHYFNVKTTRTTAGQQLQWILDATEETAYFNVEKATSPNSFTVVGTIKAFSNEKKYHFTLPDTNYANCLFRIKAIYTNGQHVYSNIIRINETPALQPTIVVTQTRGTSPFLHVQMQQLPFGKYRVTLLNASGEKIQEATLLHQTHQGLYTIPVQSINYHSQPLMIVSIYSEKGEQVFCKKLLMTQ